MPGKGDTISEVITIKRNTLWWHQKLSGKGLEVPAIGGTGEIRLAYEFVLYADMHLKILSASGT